MRRGLIAFSLSLFLFTGLSVLPSARAASYTVTIPKGAANPTVDLTLQNVGNWYNPQQLTVNQGDTVTWVNDDTEPHTVTSGVGAGLKSVQTNERGTPDGIFDSQFFGAGKSWSYTFKNAGTYSYFCTIHPWMEAVVTVKSLASVPDYPVDAQGNKQEVWPVHTYSNDGKYDIDLAWDPKAVVTGEPVTFAADFYDVPTNKRIQLVPYDFVIIQNGNELDRVQGLTQIGTGVHRYIFSDPGPVTIRIENVGGSPDSYSEFSTTVYQNQQVSSTGDHGVKRIEGGTQPVSRLINPLTMVWFTYAVIFSLPAGLAAMVILYKKGRI